MELWRAIESVKTQSDMVSQKDAVIQKFVESQCEFLQQLSVEEQQLVSTRFILKHAENTCWYIPMNVRTIPTYCFNVIMQT